MDHLVSIKKTNLKIGSFPTLNNSAISYLSDNFRKLLVNHLLECGQNSALSEGFIFVL